MTAPTLGSRKGEATARKIAGADADIAIADHKDIVLRLLNQADHLVHFVAGAQANGADEQTDFAIGKIVNYSFDDGDDGVVFVRNVEKDFEFRIILVAEAGIIFVGFAVQALYRLQNADGRRVVIRFRRTIAKETKRGQDRQEIIPKRSEREQEHEPTKSDD